MSRSAKHMKEMYHARKAQQKCVICGEDLRGEPYVRCEKCRSKLIESKKWYREHGICPICKTNDLFGEEKNCVECKAKSTEYTNIRRNSDREKYNQEMRDYHRNVYQYRKENGLCVRCGKENNTKYSTCEKCRIKHKDTRDRRKIKIDRKDRYKYGICFFCENDIIPGYKVCTKHYEQLSEMRKHENVKNNINNFKQRR